VFLTVFGSFWPKLVENRGFTPEIEGFEGKMGQKQLKRVKNGQK